MISAIPVELLVYFAGDPEKRQLTECGEIADSEVVAEGGVDLLRPVHVAVHQPSPQRLRRHVDQFDLLCLAHHRIGHGLALPYTGDLVDNVIERFQVLHVHRGDHGDPGVEELLYVLPALLVRRAGGVGVSQFVHESDLGSSG